MMSRLKALNYWPILIFAALLLAHLALFPSSRQLEVKEDHLYGTLVDIARNSVPLLVLSLGMTLVVATKGIDISVGAVMAIAGAIAVGLLQGKLLAWQGPGLLVAAVGLALVCAALLGLCNGLLVVKIGLQPIIATLILMVAGRGIAQLLLDGQVVYASNAGYNALGNAYFVYLPISLFIFVFLLLGFGVLFKMTALGLYIRAIGTNPVAAYLVGIPRARVLLGVYALSGFCAGLAGIVATSHVMSADSNNSGNLMELDAILAVALGGNSLNGGKFSFTGSIFGALTIQTITTTVYTMGMPAETNLVIKALLVVAVMLVQSPALSAKLRARQAVLIVNDRARALEQTRDQASALAGQA